MICCTRNVKIPTSGKQTDAVKLRSMKTYNNLSVRGMEYF